MDLINTRLNDYMTDVLPDRSDVLIEMEEYAYQKHFPIVGPLVGSFLRQLAYIIQAKNIFEMGSGFGYSAQWFARSMSSNGKIICTDGSDDNKKRGIEYLKRTGYDSLVEYHVGDAREIIKNFNGPFDIIFNDIDKEQYPEAFDLALPRLRNGGIFITDNVLWSGKIVEDQPDEETLGIMEFNRKLFGSSDIISSIIPIRDGLGMAVKL